MISRSFGTRTTTTSPMMRSKGFGLYSAGRLMWPAANKRFCQGFCRKFGAMHKMRLRYVNFLYKSASISLNGEFSEVQCKGGSLYTLANKCSPLAPVKPGYFTPKELRKGAESCGCVKELDRSCACKGFLLYIGAAQPAFCFANSSEQMFSRIALWKNPLRVLANICSIFSQEKTQELANARTWVVYYGGAVAPRIFSIYYLLSRAAFFAALS